MKKIVLFLLAFVSLFSCEKVGTESNVLVGRWQLVKYEQETVYANGKTVKTSQTIEGNEFRDFNKDGTVKCTDKTGSIKEYTYSLDRDNMVLTIGSTQMSLKELTKNTLVTIDSTIFLDGSVKPVGRGTNYFYNYWNKL